MTQKDNTTFRHKVALRRQALALLENPIILETHGGVGKLYRALYAGMAGMVFEKDERKAEILAGQRPTWAVYHADCVMALQAGAGSWLPINFVDCDPYGAPWTTLHAFLQSDRPHPPSLVVVVNDGLRRAVRMGRAWSTDDLQPVVERFGNDIHDSYLAVCRWMLEHEATQAGYVLSRFEGYYCGHVKLMTHYLAVLHQ